MSLEIIRTPRDMQAFVRSLPRPVGAVPTMGALHAGHLELARRARDENASVVASIFVNPKQFRPGEDFAKYPRSFASDCEAFAGAGVAGVYAPAVETMYPPGFATTVRITGATETLEGALRPGHFEGVCTVVVKLLSAMQPDRVYFGLKDAQQTVVMRRLIADLDLPVELVLVPTVREPDGLALSSRNVYLSPQEREVAPGLYAALREIADGVARGEGDLGALRERARAHLRDPAREAYLELVDGETFAILTEPRRPAFAVGSVYLGTTRLIDAVPVE